MCAAGLGLRLHDLFYRSDYTRAFDQWWPHAETAYLHLDQQQPETITFYYDPLLDHHHELPRASGLGVALYLLPQRPEAARRLFDWSAEIYGWSKAEPALVDLPGRPRTNLLGMVLARELGLDDLYGSFRAFADEHWQPRWDRERGELTWGFGLDEEHPRGQYNATIALAEALSPGAWSRLFNQPDLSRHDEPEVTGVDFPDVLLSRASWDGETEHLTITTVPRNETVAGRPTRFQVSALPEERTWRVERNGESFSGWQLDDFGDLEIRDQTGHHTYVIRPA